MKQICIVLLIALLLLPMVGCLAPREDTIPPSDSTPVENSVDDRGLELSKSTPVQNLADQRLLDIGANRLEGETAIRAIYQHLVETVYFADPVELDAFRYLPGADANAPIPYLENRALSPLLFDIGSCEDFAAATVLLLQAAGFDAHYVAGFTLSVEGNYIDHAWAVVKLEESWYHLDPQLEQNVLAGGPLTFRYYLKGDTHMMADHRWGENLIEMWPHMPDYEKAAIRKFYSVPACPANYPAPDAQRVEPPRPPDRAEVEAKVAQLKRDSGLDELPGLPLNVEPPILVAEYHITPPLTALHMEAPRHARSLLSGGAAELYDTIAGATLRYEQVDIPIPTGLSDADAAAAIEAYQSDHPEHFDLVLSFGQGDSPRTISITWNRFPQEATARIRALEQRADALLGPVRSQPEFVKALYIYDLLALSLDYDEVAALGDNTHAYGALINSLATCDGYARAFQYLCHRAGLDCLYIQGQTLRGVPHAWNLLRIDGQYAYVDATWARPLGPYDDVYHDFFLMDGEAMLRERSPDAGYAKLPETSGGDYYTRMGYAVNATSLTLTEDLAAIFLRQLAQKPLPPGQYEPVFLEVAIWGDAGDFEEAQAYFVEHIFAVTRAMRRLAAEANLAIEIATDTSVACDFNETTRVITFYPHVRKLED